MFRPRILAHGPPNHGKTKAIVNTFPRPIYVVNAPGERGGHGSLPEDDPTCVVHPDIDPTAKSADILRETEAAVLNAIKSGKYQTIAFEGAHKYIEYVMDYVTGGEYFAGRKFDWSHYGLCYRYADLKFNQFLINNTQAIILTAWSKEKGERAARKGEKPEDVPKTIYPAFLGEYARNAVGGIQMCFAQTLRPYPDGRKDAEGQKLRMAVWQTRPTPGVQGCGMKAPDKIVEGMPLYIPADYHYLQQKWEELA